MAAYWVHTPQWIKRFFPKELVWHLPSGNPPTVYLTFDDGPHPSITSYVLQLLDQYNAKATFFCVGENVLRFPETYNQVTEAGHAVGNHTHQHLNGWKTSSNDYLNNIGIASQHIRSNRFRPPYGRITRQQVRLLSQKPTPWKIYMWDVLSADFDQQISPEQCLENVLAHIKPGAIVLFHDSIKAWDRMSYALPHVLAYCQAQGWRMSALP